MVGHQNMRCVRTKRAEPKACAPPSTISSDRTYSEEAGAATTSMLSFADPRGVQCLLIPGGRAAQACA